MEELEALLKELETPGTPRDPPGPPKIPPGTPPPQGPGGDPEQLYSSVRRPRPPPAAPPPPGLGELERLLRDLSATRSGPEDELLAPPPEDGAEIRGSAPPREAGTPPGPPGFGEGAPRSAASRELERLLASLADFHLQQPQAPPKAAPGAGEELEALLQRLQAELRGRGVPTGARGGCRACGEPLRGQAVRALGGCWHPEHFLCGACGAALGPGGFLGRAGVPLCPPCGAPRCQRCREPVIGTVVTALGQTWHPEHFCCSHCGDVLGDEGFLERGGLPFCRRDFGALFGERCRRCGDPVLGEFVAALGGLWHRPCFVCQDCGSALPGGSFYPRGGAPVCQRHFRQQEGAEPAWGRS